MSEATSRDGEQPRNTVKSTAGADATQPVPMTFASDSETQAPTGGSAASDPFNNLGADVDSSGESSNADNPGHV